MVNPNEFSQPASYLNGGPFEATWGPYATKEAACLALKNEVDADGRNMRSGKKVAIGTETDYVEHAWIGSFEDVDLKPVFDGLATKEISLTTTTLASEPARPVENKIIIPGTFGSNAIIADFIDNTLYFNKTKKLIKITVANSTSGQLEVSRGTINSNPPIANSVLTKLTTIVLDIVSGQTEYDIDLTVNQGEWLIVKPLVSGVLKYKVSAGITAFRFSNDPQQVVQQVIANTELGIGYMEFVDSGEYPKKEELSTFVKDIVQPDIDAKGVEVKQASINVDTLNAVIVDNSGKDVNITPSLYQQNATATTFYWIVSKMYFTEAKRISKILVANSASGQLEVCRVTINGNPPVAGNVLTKLSTNIINIVSGVFEYDIDLTVNQGEWLAFRALATGVLKYKSSEPLQDLYSFNFSNSTFQQAIDSYDLGVGYKVLNVQPPEAAKKIQLIEFIRTNQNNATPTTEHYILNRLYGRLWGLTGDSTAKGHTLISGLVWDALISGRNNMTVSNYGINGNRLTNTGGTGVPLVLRFSEMSNDFDYVLISILTNDAASGVAIGNDSDTVDTTVKGALNILCDGLLTKYPGKKIGFISPELRNANYQAYITALETICAKFSIPVFNNAKNGGVCWTNSAQVAALTLNDTYHLNAAGMLYKSYKYEAFLRSL